jgi:hypothetical protein
MIYFIPVYHFTQVSSLLSLWREIMESIAWKDSLPLMGRCVVVVGLEFDFPP